MYYRVKSHKYLVFNTTRCNFIIINLPSNQTALTRFQQYQLQIQISQVVENSKSLFSKKRGT